MAERNGVRQGSHDKKALRALTSVVRAFLDLAALTVSIKISLIILLVDVSVYWMAVPASIIVAAIISGRPVGRGLGYALIAVVTLAALDTAYGFGRVMFALSPRNLLLFAALSLFAGAAWWKFGTRMLAPLIALTGVTALSAMAVAAARDAVEWDWLSDPLPAGVKAVWRPVKAPLTQPPALMRLIWPDRYFYRSMARYIALDDQETTAYLSISGPEQAVVMKFPLNQEGAAGETLDCPVKLVRDMVFDPRDAKLYMAEFAQGRLMMVDAETMSCIDQSASGFRLDKMQNIALDESRNALVAVSEFGAVIRRFDNEISYLELNGRPQEVAYDEQFGTLYVCGCCGPYKLWSVDIPDLKLRSWKYVHSLVWGLAGDFKGRRIFISRTMLGDVLIFQADTMERIGRFPVATGVRVLLYDPGREYLYAADYLRGYVHVIDGESLQEVGEIRLWPMIRDMALGPKSNDLYVACSTGLFRVDVEEALGQKR